MHKAMYGYNGTEPEIEQDRDGGFVRVRLLFD